MSLPDTVIESITEMEPRRAAAMVAAAHELDGSWLDEFAEHLDRHLAGQSLTRTLRVWGLSQAETGRLFGVSRQAVSKWIDRGVPAERAEAIADLAAATDLLVHHLERDRIPAVVRRPARALGGRSLIDLVAEGDTRAVLKACRDMFAFERASS